VLCSGQESAQTRNIRGSLAFKLPESNPEKDMRRFHFALITFALLFVASPAEQLQAQDSKRPGFDVSRFLTRLDRNQNGQVEPDEIPDDRPRGFLEKAGVDVSKSINIKSFSTKIKKKKQERANSNDSNRSLSPGFSVDREEQSARRFEVTDAERNPIPKGTSFSDDAKKMADWAMKNYDRNRDGKIDSNEIKSAKWGDPSPKESDTNKDGSLSRNELLVRYQKREKKTSKRRSRRESRTDSKDLKKRSSWSRSTKIEKTDSTDRKSRDVRKSYERYVDGIFKSQDKDKDGYLNREEIKAMRNKPSKDADTDKDKRISREELLDSYLAKAGQRRNGSGNSKNDEQASTQSTKSAAGNQPRPQLTSKDKNRNGQIEMAEYSSKWTASMVAEFYSKDKNRDGVITPQEWNGK
jgi:hypothetical protein